MALSLQWNGQMSLMLADGNHRPHADFRPLTILLAMRFLFVTISSTSWLTVNAAEAVEVWLTPPSWVDARHRAETDAQSLVNEAARNKSLWSSMGAPNLTYTLTATDGGLISLHCNGVPIRIKILKGRVVSALYQSDSERCRRERNALRTADGRPVLTPGGLFHLVEDALKVRPDVECLKVRFDEKTGLPLKIEGGCPWLSDSYWSVEVTDLIIDP
jgi:hypothetical protein